MKKFLLFLSIAVYFTSQSQVYNRDEVNLQKKQGKLTGKEKYRNPTGGTKNFKVNHINQTTSANSCNCWITRDSTFSVVPFDAALLNFTVPFCMVNVKLALHPVVGGGGGGIVTVPLNLFSQPFLVLITRYTT